MLRWTFGYIAEEVAGLTSSAANEIYKGSRRIVNDLYDYATQHPLYTRRANADKEKRQQCRDAIRTKYNKLELLMAAEKVKDTSCEKEKLQFFRSQASELLNEYETEQKNKFRIPFFSDNTEDKLKECLTKLKFAKSYAALKFIAQDYKIDHPAIKELCANITEDTSNELLLRA